MEDVHAFPPTARPRARAPHRCRGEDRRRHIIPDTAKEKPQEGEIIAAGPGGRNEQGQLIPIDVKPGDRVLFGKWSGTEVKIDGQDYLIMEESDLLGVIDKTGSVKKAA
jgi:chaperonin GroES